jgi:hypothetical protein
MSEFPTIRIEGGLLGPDILEQLLAEDLSGQKPRDFGMDGRRSLVDEIAAEFANARAQWEVFQHRLERLTNTDPATSVTRDAWVIPFLSLLGYELRYNPRAYEIDGLTFAISHRAGDREDAPPVHIVGARQELGRVAPTGRPRLAPHSLVQEFLNRTEHLWGLVTNGKTLRLLRDSTYIRRQAYIEFDLQQIFEEQRFRDFVALFRLLHRTRLPGGTDDARECLLEQYYQHALEQGGRVRERLREGVEECLKQLANGFLTHPSNEELRRQVSSDLHVSGHIHPEDFYRELLRLVYRFLFLFVSEERGLISDNSLYREHYGVARLRKLLDRRSAYTVHDDLWCSLRVLWKVLSNEQLAGYLSVAPLNGELFAPLEIDSYTISNRNLLEAFWYLSYYRESPSAPPRRVNYAALDVEELGSVYESLLDYHPRIDTSGSFPCFRLVSGSERKSTGSYYTPAELVTELIHSALEPVLQERLRSANTKDEKERAILSLRILDPACGSGHFLLAAARRLGKELARARTGEDEPAPERVREAIRDVVAHCIYGVDKNPLAVELCKVALWLEAHAQGKPLAFLDHHIRCGDSLIGVTDLEVLKQGIPDEAFEPLTGDDKDLANQLKKLNRQQRRDLEIRQLSLRLDPGVALQQLGAQELDLDAVSNDSPDQIRRKKQLYEQHRHDPERQKLLTACHLWTAAFFQPMVGGQHAEEKAITTQVVLDGLDGRAHPQAVAAAEALAIKHHFFHWPLEFPEVFTQGGFDVVLGNPPWEQIQLSEEEFFATCLPHIANSAGAERKKQIERLQTENPAIYQTYQDALRFSEALRGFIGFSKRFQLTGRGKANTYAVFAETMRALIAPTGRVGAVLPTGIATDATTQHFFQDLVEQGALVSLYDFENRRGIFPAVHRSYKFCLFTLTGSAQPAGRVEFAFFCQEAADLADPERRFTLDREDFRLLNPNTRTAPIFRSRLDAELTKHIYRRVPVLVNEANGPAGNPWKVEFRQGLFNMTSDSALFRTQDQLKTEGFRLEGNVFVRGNERYLPLYEAKMVHQFDHRFGDYRDLPLDSSSTQLPEVPLARLQDPDYRVLPRYWVPEAEVESRLAAKGWDRGWLLGWRDITNVTNERTVIAAVIPRVGVGNTLPLFLCRASPDLRLMLSTISSLALDFVARQKVGGTHLTFNYLEQLPVLPPDGFERPLPFRWDGPPSPMAPERRPPTAADFIRPRVLELTYTAWDLEPFARDLGYEGPPFRYDPERRALLRAELDALFFLLYLGTAQEWQREAPQSLQELFPIPRDAAEHILEQFPIVKRHDEERFGEYRTKRMILEIYDAMQEAINTGRPWSSIIKCEGAA